MIIFQVNIYTEDDKINVTGVTLVSDRGLDPPTPAERIIADQLGQAVNVLAEGLVTVFGAPIIKEPYEPTV